VEHHDVYDISVLMLTMIEKINDEIYSCLIDEDQTRFYCYNLGIMMTGIMIFAVRVTFFN